MPSGHMERCVLVCSTQAAACKLHAALHVFWPASSHSACCWLLPSCCSTSVKLAITSAPAPMYIGACRLARIVVRKAEGPVPCKSLLRFIEPNPARLETCARDTATAPVFLLADHFGDPNCPDVAASCSTVHCYALTHVVHLVAPTFLSLPWWRF
jgi:hypothetical protein